MNFSVWHLYLLTLIISRAVCWPQLLRSPTIFGLPALGCTDNTYCPPAQVIRKRDNTSDPKDTNSDDDLDPDFSCLVLDSALPRASLESRSLQAYNHTLLSRALDPISTKNTWGQKEIGDYVKLVTQATSTCRMIFDSATPGYIIDGYEVAIPTSLFSTFGKDKISWGVRYLVGCTFMVMVNPNPGGGVYMAHYWE